ncbi:ParB N-terminal domain-containing protein [Methanosphaera sp.]|jgi:ParB-like chromosome segregation protein Spo0J|uniref:ParB N-terminal domain-containing protein n=1 Tax=Methanosphaera sp. TaxID=2666342 RepID=UPI003D8B7C30
MGKYDMRIVKMKLSDCVSPDFNPRRISEGEFERLKDSIRRYGYSDPIIINQRNNHIVAGNQRYKALCELNRENHGKYTLIDVVLVDLDLDDEKAFNIGHNKIGGEFDEAKLETLLEELKSQDYDMALTGFVDEYENLDVDLSGFGDDPDSVSFSSESYIITVKCVDLNQMNHLFNLLKDKGYNVKSTRF